MLTIIPPCIIWFLIAKALKTIKGFWLGKGAHSYPAFSGNEPILIGGATLLPQSLWVLGVTALVVVALWYFFSRTLAGKAILATSCNPLAAQLVAILARKLSVRLRAVSSRLGTQSP